MIVNATPSSLDAHPLSPGARELLAALEERSPGLYVVPINTGGGAVADGLIVSRSSSRRLRIWPSGRLWMVRPELRKHGDWYFMSDAGRTTPDPRQALRAACSGTEPTAALIIGWLAAADPRDFPPHEG